MGHKIPIDKEYLLLLGQCHPGKDWDRDTLRAEGKRKEGGPLLSTVSFSFK